MGRPSLGVWNRWRTATVSAEVGPAVGTTPSLEQEATDYAKWKAENCAKESKARVVILHDAHSAGRTAANEDDLRHCDDRRQRRTIGWDRITLSCRQRSGGVVSWRRRAGRHSVTRCMVVQRFPSGIHIWRSSHRVRWRLVCR